jgi:hypothetical protein
LITDKQLLYRISKEEVIEAYNRFVKRIETNDISPERKEKLLDPGRDIISLISTEGIFKHAS